MDNQAILVLIVLLFQIQYLVEVEVEVALEEVEHLLKEMDLMVGQVEVEVVD